jgi:stearoyl-CoA desaturase (Delta-9 desaturase)
MQIKLDHLPVDEPVDVDTPDAPLTKHGSAHTVWPARLLTAFIVLAPFAALGIIIAQALNGGISVLNLVLATVFYVVIAHGVTIGFHRLFTHGAFKASRPLKIGLAVLGSMSFQGSLIGWVADHRRHHMFSDKEGDPHSPVWPDTPTLRGLGHAHMGWFFKHESSSRERFAPDLLADRDLVLIDKLFVPFCVATLVLPFALGWAITGSFAAGVAAFLWAGVLRVGLFHHVSWATNSLCHVVGKRPFRTTDRSSNVAPLAFLSMGEAWHNAHHAFPSLARHGVDRFQVDTSALFIRLFERLGWATRVRWPETARLNARRVAFTSSTPR